MSKINEKKQLRRLLFVSLIGICLTFTIVPRAKTVYNLNKQKIILENKKEELSNQNLYLQETMKDASSTETIERIAREQLGLVKDGELTIIPVFKEEAD